MPNSHQVELATWDAQLDTVFRDLCITPHV